MIFSEKHKQYDITTGSEINSLREENTRPELNKQSDEYYKNPSVSTSLLLNRRVRSPYANNFVQSPYRNNFVKSPYQNNFVKTPYGNNIVESPFRTGTVQAKLKVSSTKDQCEQEADRMANAVMNNQDVGSLPSITENNPVQAKSSAGGIDLSTEKESRINSLNSGRPLPETECEFFERKFNTDFSDVRIYNDSHAGKLSESLNARAFTRGQDIVFGEGEYQPHTDEGKRLLAHELAHVVQQRKDGIKSIQRWTLPTDWLDYVGLTLDIAERIYIELAYKEGKKKDFQRFVNNVYFAIDLAFAAAPAVGGVGIAARSSKELGAKAWESSPAWFKDKVISIVAEKMGWAREKTFKSINKFFEIKGEHVAKKNKLQLPKAVGADVKIVINSKLKDSSYAKRLAEEMSQQAQADVDSLINKFSLGNTNPGIGNKNLGNNFWELRGRNGGRVILKQKSAGEYDIVGKFQGHVRGDVENSKIIQKLIDDYNKLFGE